MPARPNCLRNWSRFGRRASVTSACAGFWRGPATGGGGRRSGRRNAPGCPVARHPPRRLRRWWSRWFGATPSVRRGGYRRACVIFPMRFLIRASLRPITGSFWHGQCDRGDAQAGAPGAWTGAGFLSGISLPVLSLAGSDHGPVAVDRIAVRLRPGGCVPPSRPFSDARGDAPRAGSRSARSARRC